MAKAAAGSGPVHPWKASRLSEGDASAADHDVVSILSPAAPERLSLDGADGELHGHRCLEPFTGNLAITLQRVRVAKGKQRTFRVSERIAATAPERSSARRLRRP